MHRPIPASPYDLDDPTGIVAVGLVRHRSHRGICLARRDANRRYPRSRQGFVQPVAQRVSFQTDALHRHPQRSEEINQRLWLTRNLSFPNDAATLIDRGDRRFFEEIENGGGSLCLSVS